MFNISNNTIQIWRHELLCLKKANLNSQTIDFVINFNNLIKIIQGNFGNVKIDPTVM